MSTILTLLLFNLSTYGCSDYEIKVSSLLRVTVLIIPLSRNNKNQLFHHARDYIHNYTVVMSSRSLLPAPRSNGRPSGSNLSSTTCRWCVACGNELKLITTVLLFIVTSARSHLFRMTLDKHHRIWFCSFKTDFCCNTSQMHIKRKK